MFCKEALVCLTIYWQANLTKGCGELHLCWGQKNIAGCPGWITARLELGGWEEKVMGDQWVVPACSWVKKKVQFSVKMQTEPSSRVVSWRALPYTSTEMLSCVWLEEQAAKLQCSIPSCAFRDGQTHLYCAGITRLAALPALLPVSLLEQTVLLGESLAGCRVAPLLSPMRVLWK